MATNHYSNIGKDGIVKEGIFVRFPDFEPASKENYWNSNKHRKLLIVAESSYFEDEAESVYKSVFKDPVAWYTGEDTQHLIPIPETDPKKYTTKVNNWKAGYTPFNNLCKSINNVSNDFHCSAVYEEAMFYNYFLRPATVRVIRGKKNLSFKKDCIHLDREVAGTALCGIIELDKPDIVIFVSKYAFQEFKKHIDSKGCSFNNTHIDFVYHPSLPLSWNHRNGNGRQKFERLLSEYWIVK